MHNKHKRDKCQLTLNCKQTCRLLYMLSYQATDRIHSLWHCQSRWPMRYKTKLSTRWDLSSDLTHTSIQPPQSIATQVQYYPTIT